MLPISAGVCLLRPPNAGLNLILHFFHTFLQDIDAKIMKKVAKSIFLPYFQMLVDAGSIALENKWNRFQMLKVMKTGNNMYAIVP